MAENYWTTAYRKSRELGMCRFNDYEPGTFAQPEWCWRNAIAPSEYCWQHSGADERDSIRAARLSQNTAHEGGDNE